MVPLEDLLDQLYGSQERLTRDEIQRRAVRAALPAKTLVALDSLPEGEYAYDEVRAAIAETEGSRALPEEAGGGVPASTLSDEDLLRELGVVHRTRHDTLRHGSEHAVQRHTQRMAELEGEYLRRFPEREVDPERERAGARQRRETP